MKRYMMTLMLALLAWNGMRAMDYETAREQAYYLTDKMAYELNLNDRQYNDAYEINLDYLLSLDKASDLGGAYLAYRNDDLRHILYDWQWRVFATVDYLFRPVGWLYGRWYYPVYSHYRPGYYFYHRPTIFWEYRGGHGRMHFAGGFYHNRRPSWHGGLRGRERSMVGRQERPEHHRNGQPGAGRGERRGEFRPESHRQDGYNRNNGNQPGRIEGNRPQGSLDNRHGRDGGVRSSSRITVNEGRRGGAISGNRGGSASGSHRGGRR